MRVIGMLLGIPEEHQRRVGQVPVQNRTDRLAYRCQFRRGQVAFGEYRRESGGQQQRVAVAQGQLERFGQPNHHRATRLRPALLEEAQVALAGLGANRQVELADPAQGAPVPTMAEHPFSISRAAAHIISSIEL